MSYETRAIREGRLQHWEMTGGLPPNTSTHYPDYCGPAAVSAITGETRFEAARRLAAAELERGRRQRVSKSTSFTTIKRVLRNTPGVTVTKARSPEWEHDPREMWGKNAYPTVAQWLRREGHSEGLWLVCAGHHFMVFHNGETAEDNGGTKMRARVVRALKAEVDVPRVNKWLGEQRERFGRSGPMSTRIYKSAKALINEHDLDPEKIPGSGSGGAITKADVETYLEEIEDDGSGSLSQQDIIRAGLEKGLSNAEIVENVREAFPDSEIEPGWVSWTIGNERRRETEWWQEFGEKVAEDRGVKLEA